MIWFARQCHYNRYRNREATAKLVAVSGELVAVAFSGSFCCSCEVGAYFEDVICQVKRLADKMGLDIVEAHWSAGSFDVD
jgi:hypothetical protein